MQNGRCSGYSEQFPNREYTRLAVKAQGKLYSALIPGGFLPERLEAAFSPEGKRQRETGRCSGETRPAGPDKGCGDAQAWLLSVGDSRDGSMELLAVLAIRH